METRRSKGACEKFVDGINGCSLTTKFVSREPHFGPRSVGRAARALKTLRRRHRNLAKRQLLLLLLAPHQKRKKSPHSGECQLAMPRVGRATRTEEAAREGENIGPAVAVTMGEVVHRRAVVAAAAVRQTSIVPLYNGGGTEVGQKRRHHVHSGRGNGGKLPSSESPSSFLLFLNPPDLFLHSYLPEKTENYD